MEKLELPDKLTFLLPVTANDDHFVVLRDNDFFLASWSGLKTFVSEDRLEYKVFSFLLEQQLFFRLALLDLPDQRAVELHIVVFEQRNDKTDQLLRPFFSRNHHPFFLQKIPGNDDVVGLSPEIKMIVKKKKQGTFTFVGRYVDRLSIDANVASYLN